MWIRRSCAKYYLDFRATIGGASGQFPYGSLDEFIENLDGDPNEVFDPERGLESVGIMGSPFG